MRIGDGSLGDARVSPPPPLTTKKESARDEPSAFARVLGHLGKEVDRGETLMRNALGKGGKMETGDLIALQAGVYRYSEAVDLSSKLVDRATSGVKTVIQGQ